MITPNQIKEKELSTAAHGYDIDETNAFLNEIADSYSAIYAENKEDRKSTRLNSSHRP